jgi:hypothetical protein
MEVSVRRLVGRIRGNGAVLTLTRPCPTADTCPRRPRAPARSEYRLSQPALAPSLAAKRREAVEPSAPDLEAGALGPRGGFRGKSTGCHPVQKPASAFRTTAGYADRLTSFGRGDRSAHPFRTPASRQRRGRRLILPRAAPKGGWQDSPTHIPHAQVPCSPFEEAETTDVATLCARGDPSAATAAGSRAGLRTGPAKRRMT